MFVVDLSIEAIYAAIEFLVQIDHTFGHLLDFTYYVLGYPVKMVDDFFLIDKIHTTPLTKTSRLFFDWDKSTSFLIFKDLTFDCISNRLFLSWFQ